jgi:hypothetical protein
MDLATSLLPMPRQPAAAAKGLSSDALSLKAAARCAGRRWQADLSVQEPVEGLEQLVARLHGRLLFRDAHLHLLEHAPEQARRRSQLRQLEIEELLALARIFELSRTALPAQRAGNRFVSGFESVERAR